MPRGPSTTEPSGGISLGSPTSPLCGASGLVRLPDGQAGDGPGPARVADIQTSSTPVRVCAFGANGRPTGLTAIAQDGAIRATAITGCADFIDKRGLDGCGPPGGFPRRRLALTAIPNECPPHPAPVRRR